MKRKDLVQFLEGAKENRLTNVELDDFLDLYGDEEFSLKFHFISRSLSFGNQKDPKYNDGHAVICNVDGLDVECSLLFTVDEKDQAEALESGNVFNSKVHVLDYDSLYQRIIFGNKGPLEALDSFYANQSKSDEKVVPENNADRADLIEESQVGPPKENLEQFTEPLVPIQPPAYPDKPLPPAYPDKPLPILLDKNDRAGGLQIEDDVNSEIFDDAHGDVVEESVEGSAVPSNDTSIYTQSSAGAGCFSGFFISIGIPVTLVGCVSGAAPVGFIGLILIGIGVAVKYADSEGNGFSLKKSLAKKSGDNNSKSNKGINWAVLGSLYVAGTFLLFPGMTQGKGILILIGLIIIGIGIAYQKAMHDRKKGSS